MILSSILLLLALSAAALPAKRAVDDTTVLNFALTLEHLENAFYSQALAKFSQADFTAAGLPPFARGRFEQVAEHEKTHVSVLEKVLGPKATKPCTYKFPFKDPKSFAALSAALEGVGVSAYAGAAQFITDKKLLTAAATILSTEARHASWVRSSVNKGSGWSGAFDVPLGLNEVFSLAAPFIDTCPSTNPPLPVKAFPSLTFSTIHPGSLATLKTTPAINAPAEPFAAFLTGLDTIYVPVLSGDKVAIPSTLRGVVYAVLTKTKDSIKDEDVLAGPAILDIEFDSNGNLRV